MFKAEGAGRSHPVFNRRRKEWSQAMKKRFRTAALCLAVLLLCAAPAAAAPYRSYIYINGNNGVIDAAAPTAYVPAAVYDADNLDTNLSAPEDICLDDEGNFYILDSGTGFIHSYTPEWEKRFTIFGYLEAGQQNPTALQKPQGICIWNDTLYVAETDAGRIDKFDIRTRQLVGFLDQPESDLFDEGFSFRPKKVEVDNTGRIFVVAENVNQGLMELNQQGDFVGFVGSNEVVASPFEVLFRMFLTEKQIQGRISFVPVEYTNISLDPSGFIYAVTAVSAVNTPIRRLNPAGEDILVRNPVNGVNQVSGDLLYNEYDSSAAIGPSSFVDIAVNDQGIYFALDNNRGRVFAYDEDGNMLFEFGANNTYQVGTFIQPSALEIVGDTVYVLDRERKCLTAFQPTDYAATIMEATRSYTAGDYETSRLQWESLLKRNCNFDLAFVKAGFCLYRLGEYQQAMEYFELANARQYYTKALVKYRTGLLAEHFTLLTVSLAAAVVLLIALIWLLHRRRRRRSGPDGGKRR